MVVITVRIKNRHKKYIITTVPVKLLLFNNLINTKPFLNVWVHRLQDDDKQF